MELIDVTLAGDGELLDFVGAAGGGGGVDCDLEEFSACVQHSNQILLISLGCFVGYFEGTGGVG